jgi:hypothetical protein
MKTVAEKDQRKEGKQKPAKRNPKKSEELKTDGPLSEKDETKRAEERLREIQKKQLHNF